MLVDTRFHVSAHQEARNVRTDAHAVHLAARDPRVPWFAKVLAIVVAAYALSPIDLIPDFVPVAVQINPEAKAGVFCLAARSPPDRACRTV